MSAGATGSGPLASTPIRRLVAQLQGTGIRMVDAGPPEVVFISGANGFSYGDTTLVPRRDLITTADGFDLRFTYTNNTSQPQAVGLIQISDLRLSDRIEVLDARSGAEVWGVFDRNVEPGKSAMAGYPGDLYSPVAVLRDDRYTVGISVTFPVLEYHHGVNIRVGDGRRWSGDGGPFWYVRCELPTTIPPGQNRVYTLSVRVAPRVDNWLKTLIPYRDYFRSAFGTVQYERDVRPATAVGMAFEHNVSPSNPRGFAYPNLRPDINGWRPWALEITARRSIGYQRAMVWAAAGVYGQNRFKNYPSNSLSPMDSIPMMRNTKSELANAASPTMQVGYWLGYSTRYETAWDTPSPQRYITLGNAEQEGYFYRELDFAASLNATLIGLDAYAHDDPYFLHAWLTKLRARTPQMKFIAEVSPPDFIHTLAGGFFFENDIPAGKKPLLMDFLVPGHETWVSIWGTQLQRDLRRRPTMAELVAAYQSYADDGYVPLDVNAAAIPATMAAARSWEVNIPPELRAPASTGGSGGAAGGASGAGNTPGGAQGQSGQQVQGGQGTPGGGSGGSGVGGTGGSGTTGGTGTPGGGTSANLLPHGPTAPAGTTSQALRLQRRTAQPAQPQSTQATAGGR